MGTRLIKWLGDPPAVDADDLWSVPDWKYENRRQIALPGVTEVIANAAGIRGLSRSYKWDKDLPNYLLEVEEADALLILAAVPNQFRDVTNNPYPEYVRHRPILIRTNKITGKKEIVPEDTAHGAFRERVEVSRIDF